MVVKGKKLTLKDHWQKLVQELEGMTFREKLEHLWEYYKWILGVFLGFVFVVCVVVASFMGRNTQVRLSGVLINVDISPDGYVWLQDGYFERIGAQEGKETVELRNMQFENPYTTVNQTYALDVQESVVALMGSRELDYLLLDELAMPFFLDPEGLLDLRELFSQAELDAMGTAVIKLQIQETGEEIPVAIDVTDTALFQDYMESDKTIYLAFNIATPRRDACMDFWQFIKGGSTDTMQTMLAGTVVDAPVKAAGRLALTQGFFAAKGYTVGDHRVDLTEQSIRDAEDEETARLVKENVLTTLADGSLDYVLCGDMDVLQEGQLLDLRQILSEQELGSLDILYRGDVPVAVNIQAAQDYVSDTAWLAFSANTARLEECKSVWAFIQPME